MSKEKGIYCYTSPRGYGKTYHELQKLQQENEKLKKENQKLKEKIRILTEHPVFSKLILKTIKVEDIKK